MPEITLAVCMPAYDAIEPATVRSLRSLQMPKTLKGIRMLDIVGMEISRARNMLTEGALAVPEVTHLLFIDADMVVPADMVTKMLAHGVPIVGGLCFSRHVPYHPILARRRPKWEARTSPNAFVYNYPPNTLFEVDSTGAAALMIERRVFEEMNAAYGEGQWWSPHAAMHRVHEQVLNALESPAIEDHATRETLVQRLHEVGDECELSEDFSFMEKARKLGFKVYVDTSIKVGHIGKITIDEDIAKRLRPFQWEEWLPDVEDKKVEAGEPVASVVIPTFNQDPRYLRAAILSAAYQTLPVEVIVVDDGSTEPVATEGWPDNVRVVRQENRGVAGALNRGIVEMRTDWFCWLSSDDLLMDRKVEVQLAALAHSRMKASFHRWQLVSSDPHAGGWATYSDLRHWGSIPEQMRHLSQFCAINGSTVMLHRDVFAVVGTFPEEMRYGQDWEFWCRAGEKFLWLPIDDILGSRREPDANLTTQIAEDPAKREIRDAEDRAIRARYMPRWAACPKCGEVRP